MAAPTDAALVKKVLANSGPSTHGPDAKCSNVRGMVTTRVKADLTALGLCPVSDVKSNLIG